MRLHLAALFLCCVGKAQSPIAVIPCEVHANGIYVRTSVNGSRPVQFQLDTAAAVHIINWTQAQRLNLPFPPSIGTANGGGDGSTSAALMQDVRLRIGDFELPADPVYAVPMDPIAARKGYALDGLIGASLLKRYVVEHDTGPCSLRLYDPATWTYSGRGATVPVKADRFGVPRITVGLNFAGQPPLSGEFIIDSGAAEATLTLSSPFVQKHGLLEAARRAGERSIQDQMMGVGGTSAMWITRVASVSLAGASFPRPVITLTEARGGTLAKSDIAGTIGGELLHRFRVTYDISRNRLFLEPSARLTAPFEADMSGLRWSASGGSFRDFSVRTVFSGSPAANAGVLAGDRLLEIDGRPSGSFDIESLRLHLRRAGQKVRLKLQRADRQFIIEILLTRMV
ncbi:MAG: aspartyl protease family protein [Bryobacterales bacterium]|nr:aspartyl protease family protein [Bryobacterales bacterium]